MDKIFIVIEDDYDGEILGYFEVEEKAQKYCAVQNSLNNPTYVMELNKLNHKGYDGITFKKEYSASIFYISDDIEEKGYKMYLGATKETTISLNLKYWFSLSGTFESQDECTLQLKKYYALFNEHKNKYGVKKALDELSKQVTIKNIYK